MPSIWRSLLLYLIVIVFGPIRLSRPSLVPQSTVRPMSRSAAAAVLAVARPVLDIG